MNSSWYGRPVPYSPPDWASSLKMIPRTRIPLCMVPTPVHEWRVPGLPAGVELAIKRDDLTGSTLTGNKTLNDSRGMSLLDIYPSPCQSLVNVPTQLLSLRFKSRKLEFLLAEAVERGCDCVLTTCSTSSNHARSTAIAARELGLDTFLFVSVKEPQEARNADCHGNLLLCRLVGATLITVTDLEGLTQHENINRTYRLMEEFSEKLKTENRKPYCIATGGSSAVGCWGYLQAWQELLEGGVASSWDDVVVCGGSGGTSAGLAIGNYLTGSNVKLHAYCIVWPADVLSDIIGEDMRQLGVKGAEPRDIITISDASLGAGYGECSLEVKELVLSVFAATGILTDSTYIAKTVQGMLSDLQTQPNKFKGKRVLFLHTGGMFNIFDGQVNALLETTPTTSRIHDYEELTSEP